jgi:hypothetical protein
MLSAGLFSLERGTNPLDSGAHYYDCLRVRRRRVDFRGGDRRTLLRRASAIVGISPEEIGKQRDQKNWARGKGAARASFQDEDARRVVQAPRRHRRVLRAGAQHGRGAAPRALKARDTFIEVGGITQPAPAPRFSRTPPDKPTPPEAPDADRALEGWLAPEEVRALKSSGVL